MGVSKTRNGSYVAQTQSTVLTSGDITLAQNSYTDALSLSLVPGVWLIFAQANVYSGSGSQDVSARITDGSTNYSSGAMSLAGTAYDETIQLTALITLIATTTIKFQGTANGSANCKFLRAGQVNSAGNTQTQMIALKLDSSNPIGVVGGFAPLDSGLHIPPQYLYDPVYNQFGTPDTAYEFNTSSLTGLTAIGTASIEDANITVAGHYYVKNVRTSGPYWSGRYAAISAPFTAITLLRHVPRTNYHCGALFIAASSPSAMDILCHGIKGVGANGDVGLLRWSDNNTYSNNPANGSGTTMWGDVYLAIVATSTSNVAYYYSWTGTTWYSVITGRDPSMTIGSVGIINSAQESTYGEHSAFDYLRIWNSAKTIIAA